MSDGDQVRLFAEAEEARRAHDCLLGSVAALGLTVKPERSAIEAIRLYDMKQRYLFAWIVNRAHLLFYLRKPALALIPGLGERAFQELTGAGRTPSGEVTIRLESLNDAVELSRWLGTLALASSGEQP